MIYFTSDTHFGHTNIIKYCSRPYANVKEMDANLIARWNNRVRPEDTVYHLGDFAFGNLGFKRRVLAALNGRKILVRGNHDGSTASCVKAGWNEIDNWIALSRQSMAESGGPSVALLMRHEPFQASEKNPSQIIPDIVLCGHVHEKWSKAIIGGVSFYNTPVINVGVDVRDYEPKTLEELMR